MDIYDQALKAYGDSSQLEQLVEESAELIVAIKHYKRGRVLPEKVIEEAVDVELMLEQLKIIYPETALRAKTRQERLERLAKLLEVPQ